MLKKIICAGLALTACVVAHADDDHMHFNGNHRTSPFDITVHGIDGDLSLTVGAGTLNFNDDGHHDQLFGSGNFDTVCADIFNQIHHGDEWDCDIRDSHTATPGLSHGGNIVQFVGDNVAPLHDLNNLDSNQSVGLQLAVWEAIYDNETPPITEANFLTDLTHGNFKVTSGLSHNLSDPILTDAWYDYTHGFSYNSSNGGAIWIQATHGNGIYGQDQFAYNHGHRFATPEPFTMGLGLAGMGLFLRRRKAKRA